MASNQIEFRSKGGKLIASGVQVPAAFLEFGVRGVRAFAWKIGSEIAAEQEAKKNPVTGIYVDGYRSRSPENMKRNIVWEFAPSSMMKKAIQEALEMAKSLSLSLARQPSGQMANSWGLYVNGAKTNVDSVDFSKLKPEDDIRITSDEVYARFLESGKWAGTKSLQRRFNKAKAKMNRKRYRGAINLTKMIAIKLKKKYKSIVVTDKWYESGKSPIPISFGKDQRWPAVLFGFRRNK
ncbi:MAG: hypothetical protein ACOVJ9_03050 [Actinomycetes bacterium]|jgi:hypothetical protein